MQIGVIGLGLIGGSVALAARERLDANVTGWDADPAALQMALDRGAIHVAADGLAAAAAASDIVIVAVPIARLADTTAAVLQAAGADAVVTDVGSTKTALVHAVTDPRFIGSHPLAGSESSGIEQARADLFAGAVWYLTPGPSSDGVAFERLHRFLVGLGAVPTAIDAEAHDRLMAAVSHLPHVLANILVARVYEALGGETLPATGPSFRDATRVAGANPALWAQIYAANAEALGAEIDATIATLKVVRDRLDKLEDWQRETETRHRALLESELAAGPLQELRVFVPNRPGVVADIALTMGHAGINIADMSLTPASDGRTGVVALWVAEADAQRARMLIDAKDLEAGIG
jgi:prephenate dehydrogenase